MEVIQVSCLPNLRAPLTLIVKVYMILDVMMMVNSNSAPNRRVSILLPALVFT